MGRLQDKVALVTGAASGLGSAIARKLHAEGARVMIGDLQDEAGARLAAELGERAASLHHDVTDEAGWVAALQATQARFGPLDVLVNNAGILEPGSLETATLAQWRRLMQVNAESVFLGCQLGVAAMRERGGSIVNVASVSSWLPVEGYVAYSASKAAVASLTRSAAFHCRRHGWPVRVNSVHPDGVYTPMMQASLPPGVPPERLLWDAQRNPKGRAYRPEAVADVVAYLASDEARVISGAELRADNALLGMGL